MTRIQLESGFIDLPKGTDFPIDLSFAEINKSGARSGGVSRSLDIEGTENNSKLLGLYFDVDLTNDTFNRNVKVRCSVIQEDTEVFDGYIQLLEIVRVNKYQSTNQKSVKYKISVFDEVSNFFNAMGDRELTDLSFPELSHIFNRANIISSWSNTDGFTYPQYAKNDNIYTLRDFKPAIYELEYFKKIFATNGYTYTFGQLTDDDIRLNQRVLPFNGKAGDNTVSQLLQERYIVRGEMATDSYLIDNLAIDYGLIPPLGILNGASINTYAASVGSKMSLSDIFQDGENQYDTVTDEIENKAGSNRIVSFLTSYNYSVQVRAVNSSSTVVPWEVLNVAGGLSRADVKVCLVAQSTTNNQKVVVIDAQQTAITFDGGESYASGWQPLATGANASTAQLGLLDANERYDIHTLVFAQYFNAAGNAILGAGGLDQAVLMKDSGSADLVLLEFDIDITDLQFKATADIVELSNGVSVNINAFIPKKIKQRDLISAIKNTYNLVFVPDPSNTSNIIIKTRDTYYNDGLEWDWTDKFIEDQPSTITFLSNDVKQRQVYKYKEDKDTLNSAYQSEFVETYGQTTIDLDNEYTVGTDARTLIYSATPSVGSGIGVPLPSINGVNPDCNIRVLLHNGVGTVSPYPFYDDILPNASNVSFVTDYCSTSMFDSDELPNFSILFNSPDILFHGFQQGQTTNYIYNLHHQNELTTINTGKRLNGYFDLTEVDFQKLSKRLDWKIFIKDNGWFFISKIYAYNSGKRTITKVDLITADEKTRIKYKRPFKPYKPTTLSVTAVINRHFDKVGNDTNIIIGGGDVKIDGKYNLVSGDKVKIQGDQNKVLSSNVMVMGNYNDIGTGLGGTKVIGDSNTPTSPSVIVGKAKKVFKVIITQVVSDDPVLYVLEDSIGIESALRVGTGSFELTATGKFPITTKVFITTSPLRTITKEVRAYRLNTNAFRFDTYLSGTITDGILISTEPLSLMIEVYP
jgi:hypothetical protein